jgi:divalent metal cation (Fe/Co/Zn/Cd) transporter
VESIQQLSDSSNEELYGELKIMVEDYVEHHDDDVLHTTSIRARQVGSSAFVDITVETPPELSTTATRAVEERLKRVVVQTLQDSGRLISATVHAKPLMVVCPLLEQRRETDDDVTATTTSASQIEYMVRQQALLLYPKIDSIPAVTVHYSAQREVTVDVKIVVSESTSSVVDVQQHARELQEHLEELPEIDHAHIYLDLNAINNNTAEQGNGNGEPKTAIPNTTNTSQNSNTTATLAP